MDHLYPLKIGSAVVLNTKPSVDLESERVPGLPYKPCARSGHCAVADEHNIYLLGGYNPDDDVITDYFGSDQHVPLFGEVWRYHIPSNRWHLLTNEGESYFRLASMSAILKGKTILIFGGTSYPFGYRSTNKISWLDVRRIDWLNKPEKGEHRPIRSYGQAIAAINPYLYVYGGTTGWVYCSDIHRCHVQTGVWERVFNYEAAATAMMRAGKTENIAIPDPRYRHEMLNDDRRLYVIGGGTSSSAFPLDKVNAFDTESRQWELLFTKPDERYGFPGPRRCHGCAQLGKVGYISGGFDGREIYDDIWMLDLTTLQWTKLQTKLPRPVYFHSSAITPNGCLFIHGGVVDAHGTDRSDALVRVWVWVPSLLRMAWNRVLSLLRDPTRIEKHTLHALGVPPSLLPDIG
nr:kelch domain-containing protein 10-like isoform X1 [Lytechinus pictus]